MKRTMSHLTRVLMAGTMLGLAACGGPAPEGDAGDVPQAAPVDAVGEVPAEQAPALDPSPGDPGAQTGVAEVGGSENGAAMDAATADAPAPAEAAGASTVTKLDLNSATAEQLANVPGSGDRMVREFLEYRPYISIVQFRRELGKYIPEAQITAYEDYLYVPVSPNASDEATLQQLPGVDGTVAAELAAGRPYASNEAFLAELASWVGEADAAAAAAYLIAP